PLPGASIVLLGTSPPIGSVSDIDGNFRIEKIEVGRHSLQVSFLGYKMATIPNIYISSAKEVVLLVELEEKVFESQEVVITASVDKTKALNQMAVVSARTFSVDETSRFAGSFRDPARIVANFAGVTASGDQRNDIIIRGNSPLGVLWRVEGLDIPSPNHFTQQGANGGPISILNNNLITNSDFFTGAFPAEYGNALSGVFDIKLRNGNNEKHEFIGQLGMNGAELSAEGPLPVKQRGSYLLSYRYSTMQIFDKIGISFGTAGIPKYQDISYKFHVPTEKSGVFSLFGLGGISNIRIIGSEQEAIEKQAGLKENKNSNFGTDMIASGLSHTFYYDNNLFHKLIIGFSGQRRRVSVDSLPLNGDPPFISYIDSTQSGKSTISYYLNKKINSRHIVRLGAIADWYQLDLKEKYYDEILDTYISLRDFGGATSLFQSYINWRFKPNDYLLFTSGLHLQYFAYNQSSSLEPRIGLSWNFAPRKSLSLGYGHHSQMQQLETYFYESRDSLGNTLKTNEDLGFTYTHHIIASYDWAFLPNFRLKIETYYQSLYNVPVYGNASSSFSTLNLGAEYGLLPSLDSLDNKGTGINYGLELTLEKFFSNNYYFLLTGSLFDSKYKGSDGVLRNTVFNGNFVFNVLAGKEFVVKKVNIFSIDAKVTTSGGNRYTPIDMEASKLYGEEMLKDDLAYSQQFDTYFRADIRLGYKRNAKKVAHEWAFDIQNIFDTENVLLQLYDEETNKIEFAYQLGIFPVVLYRIEF
ncbi:MAG TPA: TonB-dependent receptor, partial [Flavobacteriales bacterium]|nr:TonB-dependent receptor [Flavobacteriales bacterium]HIN38782.1 TonB-dependent receptor [Flavobacteriales bacterium]